VIWMKLGVFCLGVLLGSLLNNFISWWPQRETSSAGLRAVCPHCGHPWQGLETITLWGRLFAEGRCHYCGDHVPLRYILVELAAGILLVLAYSRGQGMLDVIRLSIFVLLLIPLMFIDLKHHRLPNILTLPGIALGLLLSAGLGQIKSAVLGALTGGGILFIVAVVTRGGLGMGDVKLQAMVGAFLGLRGMLVSLTIGVILGGIIGLILLALRLKGRKDMVPYGPFLITGALIVSLVIQTG
jgi:leader peptidase (prepilin peptidase)/N-methyltransferase